MLHFQVFVSFSGATLWLGFFTHQYAFLTCITQLSLCINSHRLKFGWKELANLRDPWFEVLPVINHKWKVLRRKICLSLTRKGRYRYWKKIASPGINWLGLSETKTQPKWEGEGFFCFEQQTTSYVLGTCLYFETVTAGDHLFKDKFF